MMVVELWCVIICSLIQLMVSGGAAVLCFEVPSLSFFVIIYVSSGTFLTIQS